MQDPKIHGEAFNFSNELQITVLELTTKILKLMGKKNMKPVVLNQASNEIKHQYLSAKKAREMLGWESKYDIDDALKETIAWYEELFRAEKGQHD